MTTNLTPNGDKMSADSLGDMRVEVKEWIAAKGWDDDRTFGDEIALITSELSEALEAYRSHGFDEWFAYQPVIRGVKMPKMAEDQCYALAAEMGVDPYLIMTNARWEGVAAELAGTLVRLIDTCQRHGFNLGREYRKEMDFNWTRTHRHGGRAL